MKLTFWDDVLNNFLFHSQKLKFKIQIKNEKFLNSVKEWQKYHIGGWWDKWTLYKDEQSFSLWDSF